MRRISLILVLQTFVLNSQAQTCTEKAPPADVKKMQALIGEWKGEFTDQEKTTPLTFRFYEENHELKVEINNAILSPIDAFADVSLCSTNKFHFFGRRIDGQLFTYNAQLVNGELFGNYKIGESCSKENRSAFKLKKIQTGS